MPKNIMFLELFLFYGVALAWLFWEYRKTSALLEKTREENRKKALDEKTDAAANEKTDP
ncbi:MAG: hypothetical protein AAGJ73_00415 [Pseudomonadota bacterium]